MLRIVVPSYKRIFIYLSVRPRVFPASFVRDSSHGIIRPGTPVPGYSLFRPCGTGFVRVSSFSNLAKATDKDDVANRRALVQTDVYLPICTAPSFPASFVPSLRDSSHDLIRPGTPVPGYRLFRPCGTGFVRVSSFSNLSKAADKDDVAKVVPSYKRIFIYLSVRPRVFPASFVPSLRNSFHGIIRPGTPVPGYRLFRPCGTGFVGVSSFSNLSKAADKDDVAKVVPSYKRMFIYLSVRPRVLPASFVPSLRDSSHGIIRPGTHVPGYRLFRPCGTGFVGVSSFSNLSKAADKDDVANRRALVQTDLYRKSGGAWWRDVRC